MNSTRGEEKDGVETTKNSRERKHHFLGLFFSVFHQKKVPKLYVPFFSSICGPSTKLKNFVGTLLIHIPHNLHIDIKSINQNYNSFEHQQYNIMNSDLPMVAPEQERSTKSYRNKIISVVSVGLVVVGGGLMVSASRGSTGSNVDQAISNFVAVDGHKSATATAAVLPMKVDMPKEVKKVDAKKIEAPKEEKKGADEKKSVDEKKDVDTREVDGAKAKKTSKPTVKPTTPPKPTVPPTTKKPSEKKIEREEAPKGKAPPARSLAEKGNPSPEANPSTDRAEGPKGAVEKKGDV